MVKRIDCADDPLAKLRPKEPKESARKKRVNSKSKGKTGEYYFANRLSEISGMHFQRIFTSGASVGQKNRGRLETLTVGQAEQQLGDIASPETLRQMLVWESKNFADLDLHNVIGSEDGSRTLSGWVGEMMYDVESALTTMRSQRPVMGFLCVKLTRKGAWIAVNVKGFLTAFGVRASLAAPYVVFEHEPRPALAQYGWGRQWVLEDFDRFVAANAGSMFQQMSEMEIEQRVRELVRRGSPAPAKPLRKELREGADGRVPYMEVATDEAAGKK